jgi:hypothetical protein
MLIHMGKILSFNKRRADMLRIGIAAHYFHIAADALRWRVSCVIFRRRSVDFLELGVIDVRAKSTLNGFKITLWPSVVI